MKAIIIVIFIFITCFSCTSLLPCRIKREFYCYNNGRSTGIDSLININGYYTTPLGKNDTVRLNYLFFNDGIFIRDVYRGKLTPSEYLKIVANYTKPPYGSFFNYGVYKINFDTIKAQYLDPGPANTYSAFEKWFKIIDRNTIKDIYTKTLGYGRITGKHYNDGNVSFFIKATDTLPISNTWLKKRRWFWCK